jgi:predicted Zn-dependent protease
MLHRLFLVALGIPLLACASMLSESPTGRTQLRLFPATEMSKMGATAYAEMKEQMPQSKDAGAIRLIECVSRAITAEVRMAGAPASWEVTVFEDDTANAFALPGGKIGVHTGLLKVATSQSQLAAVIGHEVAHVLAEHGNERASTTFVAQSGLQVIQAMSGPASAGRDQALAVLGLGAQVGVLLPFSRAQETEADVMGLDLMARAGFDPRQSVTLWENMGRAASGGAPPELLSTHPSNSTRINELKARIPGAMGTYDKAQKAGRRPRCG